MFQDGRVVMVLGCPLERDGVPVAREGGPLSLPPLVAEEWKIEDSPYRMKQVGTGDSLTLIGEDGTLEFCIVSYRFPAFLRIRGKD